MQPDAPTSGVRAVSIGVHARDHLTALRAHRDHLRALVATLDAEIEAAEILCAGIEALESASEGAAEANERVHLSTFGEHGELVLRVADERQVALHHLLGPGWPVHARARTARREAMRALHERGLKCLAVATILRVSEESVRQFLRRPRKAA